ncbi:metallophosphoesterase [Spirosoma rhododendri]|uniref:Metallophosphoesterase n=1 Tax=Spirosoma rhododendri TaxID=2728024 RepID=A0A7L5DL04_9BACT|nr:metallophosphoesterase [Spirosoma rhododendri]QJD77088.1 metallophosphoesterase [Spirosoma rhododendri]
MRIAFITDLHIDTDTEHTQGVDVRQNFLDVLARVSDLKPHCLVLGGDLCNRAGDATIYDWIRAETRKLPWPTYVIPGNHDDTGLMAKAFGREADLHDGELYYAVALEGFPALFLDSSKATFSAQQWTWLRDYLKLLRDKNLLVFMHHPPVPADMRSMDRLGRFGPSEEFLDLIKDLPCHVTVVCGHYHTDKVVQRGNLLVMLTPSTYVQLRPDTPDFVVSGHQVGFRELNVNFHTITSTVHYLDHRG